MMRIKAWHFIKKDRRLANDDGRLVRMNHTLVHGGELVMCEAGLHASKSIIDALQWAPGSIICRVECSGDVMHATDKLVCSRRKCLWWIDVTRVLHEFACWCAERALRRAKITDKPYWDAINTKRRWLLHLATDSDLEASSDAISDTTRYTTRYKAGAAIGDAKSAGKAAIWYAPCDAARHAARHSASVAVWTTSMDEERSMQTLELRKMVMAERRRRKSKPNPKGKRK